MNLHRARSLCLSTVLSTALLAPFATSASAADGGAYAPNGVRVAGVSKAACARYPSGRDINVTRKMYEIGQKRNVSSKVMLAMFEAGWVESWLNNLNCGDADSLGIFQMRPSMGWGTRAQLQDVTYQVNKFLDVAVPIQNRYGTAGQLAQAVERSGYPYRYDQAQATAQKYINEAFQPYGTILTIWTKLGGVNGSLGGPLAAETDFQAGVRHVPFSRGIAARDSRGTWAIWGDNYRYWSSTGSSAKYGFPTMLPKAAQKSPTGTTGLTQGFQRGWIYWSSRTGSRAVMPAMQKAFVQYGAEGRVGFPISDTVTSATGTTQTFEKAVITVNSAGVASMQAR